MNSKAKWILAAALAGVVALAAGCGAGEKAAGSAPQAASKSGKTLKVATEAAYAPFRYTDSDGHIVGFEMDLLQAVADEMDVKLEIVDTPFDKLVDTVAEKKADLAIGAITVTKQRQEKVAFSDPYYKLSGYSIVVKRGNPLDIKELKDLTGKTVATKAGSVSEALVKEEGPAKVVSMDHYADVFSAVETGAADVAVGGDQAAGYYLEHGGSQLLTVAGTIPTDDNFAIAVAKDNTKLRDDVNKALKTLMDNGKYDELSHKWFFQTPQGQKR